MQQRFTPNQLVQYLYRETSISDTFAIEETLSKDVSTREEFELLSKAYRQLPKVKFSPSERAVQNILRHSERTALTEKA